MRVRELRKVGGRESVVGGGRLGQMASLYMRRVCVYGFVFIYFCTCYLVNCHAEVICFECVAVLSCNYNVSGRLCSVRPKTLDLCFRKHGPKVTVGVRLVLKNSFLLSFVVTCACCIWYYIVAGTR